MILTPLTRWWPGQFLYGNGCVAEVKQVDVDDWLKLWILNGEWSGWYNHEILVLEMNNGDSLLVNPPGFREIVETKAGRHWPAISEQTPPWETEHVSEHHP